MDPTCATPALLINTTNPPLAAFWAKAVAMLFSSETSRTMASGLPEALEAIDAAASCRLSAFKSSRMTSAPANYTCCTGNGHALAVQLNARHRSLPIRADNSSSLYDAKSYNFICGICFVLVKTASERRSNPDCSTWIAP